MTVARELAAELATKAPIAVQYIIEAVNRGLEIPFDKAQIHEATLFGSSRPRPNCAEGRARSWKNGSRSSRASRAREAGAGRVMAGFRFAIVVSRFNEDFTEGLLRGRGKFARASIPAEG